MAVNEDTNCLLITCAANAFHSAILISHGKGTTVNVKEVTFKLHNELGQGLISAKATETLFLGRNKTE